MNGERVCWGDFYAGILIRHPPVFHKWKWMYHWDFDEHRRDGHYGALGPVWNASMVMTIYACTGGRWTICNRWKYTAEMGQVCRVNTLTTAGVTVRAKDRGGHRSIIHEVQLWGRSSNNTCTWKPQEVLTWAWAQGRVAGRPLGRTCQCHLSILVLLLIPHPAVLKPDLDLAIGELQPGGHLQPPGTTEIRVEVELFLQFQQLAVGEGRSLPPDAEPSSAWHPAADWCKRKHIKKMGRLKQVPHI